MHIRSFFIDEFGIFSHTRVEDLSPGLTIFLGRNEAGKSTCLEFLRAMLTGYPDARSREGRRLPQARGGQGGGSLELVTETEGVLRLTRRPGAGNGVLTLADADGHPREPEVLERLMCGISRDVFRSVFGFSLTELQTFASLSADGVRNALYGASFGLGLRSPGEALRRLEQQADEIFKAMCGYYDMYACANAHGDPFKKFNIYTVTFNYLLLIAQGISVLLLSSLCGKDGEIMTSQWALPYVHVQNKLDMIINSYIQTKRLLRT